MPDGKRRWHEPRASINKFPEGPILPDASASAPSFSLRAGFPASNCLAFAKVFLECQARKADSLAKSPKERGVMMEITTTIGSILDRKGVTVWSVSPNDTVFEAISTMAEKNVGALPVLEGGRLVGMVSERDYARKVILLGRGSRETTVAEIMTSNVRTVRLDDSVQACLQLMTENRIRHLPVMVEGKLAGIISIGDCVNWIISAQTAAIDDLERFVTGAYPG
jgi:CBS domain-containing protein